MTHGKPRKYQNVLYFIVPVLLCIGGQSCVKKFIPYKPFVYKTNITIEGNYSTEQKKELVARLTNQLDDSMRPKSVSKFFYNELKRPQSFDSMSADKSVQFMHLLMNKLGYFRDSIYYEVKIKPKNKQYRTTTTFIVKPGKIVSIDSILYNFKHPDLQRLTDSSMIDTYLKKGHSFSQDTIAAELDRLVEVFRNRGYLRITRDELVCGWDTLDASLLQPVFDPFEQLQQLEEIRRHRENPTVNLEIRLRPNIDSTRLLRYYVGNIVMYPDLSEDTADFTRKEKQIRDIKLIYYRNIFKLKFLPENVYLTRGELYNQRRYLRTINRFNSLGAWRLVNMEQIPRKGTDTVDFNIKLTPATKYVFNSGLEGSFNTGNVLSMSNLFGVGINFGVQNRNFARASNQSNTNIRFGTEFSATKGQQFIQTKQASIGYNINFPRSIPRFNFLPERLRDNVSTVLSLNVANTDRKDLFNLTTINAAWGYDLGWRSRRLNTSRSLKVRIPNVEYNFLTKRDSLQKLIDTIPSLRYIFNQGLVVSLLTQYAIIKERNKSTDIFRVNFEESGLLLGLIKTKAFDSLYRFIKIDVDYGHKFKFRRSELVARVFGGIGIELQSPSEDKSRYLPFFKQYFGGGPSSMRAWGLRRLGPGSTIKNYSTCDNCETGDPYRAGEIQLEANIEYRFYLTSIAGVKVNGALFTDIGNVWFRTENPDYPDGTFKFNKFYKDLAVAVGSGVRMDFNYFLIRLDYGLKARNPSPQIGDADSQGKWFYKWDLKTVVGGMLQLGINYPFGY
jgi:outer membrane protein insertion porin family